ncbi:MAG TPA: response regulator transcription factor [Candidatus Eisenbacteria bacterium]|nr:response regulator transcription factor [Candidatus Eisenbacteria bacterium]
MGRLTVVLADDHTLVRQGVRRILQADGEIGVVGEAGDGLAAVELVRQLHPTVAIVDIGLPLLNGIDAAAQMAKVDPAVKIVILSMHGDVAYVRRSLKAGAHGYVLKDADDLDLVRAVKAVAGGGSFFSPAVSSLLRESFLAPEAPATDDALAILTDRERQVLQLIAEGRSSKEIASLLDISIHTAESHRKRVMEKLDLHNTAELVRFAIRSRILEA